MSPHEPSSSAGKFELIPSAYEFSTASNYRWVNPAFDPSIVGGALVVLIDDRLPNFALGEEQWVTRIWDGPITVQQGIIPIFKTASQWTDVKAILFLDLPSDKKEVPALFDLFCKLIKEHNSDVRRIYILSDVFFSDDGRMENAIGLDVCQAMALRNLQPVLSHDVVVKFAYLSVNPPSTPAASAQSFMKAGTEHHWSEHCKGIEVEPLPDVLLKWFDRRRSTLADVSVDQWREFHETAYYWQIMPPHHWRFGGGGKQEVDEGAISKCRQDIERTLKVPLPADYHDPFKWPAFPSKHEPDERPWLRPPLRGLLQMDDMGGDLHLCLWHMEHAIRQMFLANRHPNDHHEVQIDCIGAHPLKHDYLWFNAPALAEGLVRLADGFLGEVRKIVKKDRRPAEEFINFVDLYPLIIARLQLQFKETTGPNSGLEVVIRQIVYGRQRAEHGEANHSESERRVAEYGLPPRDKVARKLKHSYELFEKAGAQIELLDGKRLRLLVAAEPLQEDLTDIVWMVSGAK